MSWIIEHKEILIGALYALVNLINMITSHPSGAQGHTKGFLWLLEVLSVTQSKDAPGWIKPPLKSVPPERPPTVEEIHKPKPVTDEVNKNG